MSSDSGLGGQPLPLGQRQKDPCSVPRAVMSKPPNRIWGKHPWPRDEGVVSMDHARPPPHPLVGMICPSPGDGRVRTGSYWRRMTQPRAALYPGRMGGLPPG
jgi:hypothetical protein